MMKKQMMNIIDILEGVTPFAAASEFSISVWNLHPLSESCSS